MVDPHVPTFVLTGLVLLLSSVNAYIVTPPTAADPATIATCSGWVIASGSNTCDSVAKEYNLSFSDFRLFNPSVGSSCAWVIGNSYCVESNLGLPLSSTTSTSRVPFSTPATPKLSSTTSKAQPTSGIQTPTPIQSGMTDNCNKFFPVKKNDTCWDISNTNGILLEDLYLWNTFITPPCEGLWAGFNICIGVLGGGATRTRTPTQTQTQTSSTPLNGIATPSPFMPGMISNCKKFYWVPKDVYCVQIVANAGITFDDFLLWNPLVGAKCKSLWAEAYVCVGIL